jgi:hypothetical protein
MGGRPRRDPGMQSIRRLTSRPWKAKYISEAVLQTPFIRIYLLRKQFCPALFSCTLENSSVNMYQLRQGSIYAIF